MRGISSKERVGAFDTRLWRIRASKYERLKWVVAPNPMKEMLLRLKVKGDEFVVDVGTGTQVVLRAIETALCQGGKVIGFDRSPDMLKAGGAIDKTHPKLLVADVTHIPLLNEVTDIVIARQVIHHIKVPKDAISEMARIIRPGGKVVIAEHVVKNEKVMDFERRLFDIKEPGRHLWLPEQLISLVENTNKFSRVDYFAGCIPNYSMSCDWLENSGLPGDVQKRALAYLREAPNGVKEELNIRVTQNDVTMDGHYLCVIAEK